MPTIDTLYVRLPNWVGDVCMSLPALAAVAETGVSLTICGRPWAGGLLAGLPRHEFVPMTGRINSDRQAVRASVRGRDTRPLGLLLPDSLSSAAVFWLAGIKSAGYRDDGRTLLLKWPFSKPPASLHAVQVWYHLTRQALLAWQLPCPEAEPGSRLRLPLTEDDQHRARVAMERAGLAPAQSDQILAEQTAPPRMERADSEQADLAGATWERANAKQANSPFVLIAPTATGLHHGKVKVWPHFDVLTRALQARGVIVAMCPPAAEVAEAQRNAPTAKRLEPVSLGTFAALARRAALVICNDSGVSHLAAAVGARQLTLFGVTSAARSGPWSPDAVCMGDENQWPDAAAVEQRTLQLLDLSR